MMPDIGLDSDAAFDTFDEDNDDDEFIYEDDEIEGSSDYDKDDYEFDENMYEDRTSERRSRSLKSSHDVPIVEESYALRRNRTNPRVDDEISRLLLNKGTPAMHHDWNDGRAPSAHILPAQHQPPFPKKYQQHRSPPIEYVPSPNRNHASRTLNENNSHQYANQHRNQQGATERSARTGRTVSTYEDKGKAFRQTIEQSQFAKLRKGRMLPENVETINTGPIHRTGRVGRSHQNRVKSIAVHYSGDTSKYANGHHENYEGNGRLRHAGGAYTDWEASPWVNILSMDRFFKLEEGVVTIQENGLYYVYAQIFYHDDHDTNGFVVQHNTQPFLQCTTMTHSHQRVTKSNTCITSGVIYLRNGDTIHLEDLGSQRYTLFEPAKSFFGLIKMGDARPLHETLA
ncbi:Protein eiger [Pseudolycoriella hygida]|uniref:Protein eiger n=1 Tax=Pseudolycoriella hygida TaxID=35572 RepID=A0A9Q0N1W4_9DIPT|nr:Protein eiger [Pseudolycoriella hygida]